MKEIQFSTMINQNTFALRNYAMKYTNNSDDAKDLMQETILKALTYQQQFQEGTNLKGWLLTIMKNTFINNFRRESRRNEVATSLLGTDSLPVAALPASNNGENSFIRADIKKALKHLSAAHLFAFLRFFEGYKYHEIASETNVCINTVKTRIYEARAVLKKKLKIYRHRND